MAHPENNPYVAWGNALRICSQATCPSKSWLCFRSQGLLWPVSPARWLVSGIVSWSEGNEYVLRLGVGEGNCKNTFCPMKPLCCRHASYQNVSVALCVGRLLVSQCTRRPFLIGRMGPLSLVVSAACTTHVQISATHAS